MKTIFIVVGLLGAIFLFDISHALAEDNPVQINELDNLIAVNQIGIGEISSIIPSQIYFAANCFNNFGLCNTYSNTWQCTCSCNHYNSKGQCDEYCCN